MAAGKRAAFATLGCKVNQCETQALSEQFAAEGYVIVPFSQEADIYVVNTCSVTQTAESKSRQLIARAHRKNPQAIIAVAGCYAQRAAGELLAMAGVRLVVGSAQKSRLPELLRGLKQEDEAVNAVCDVRSCRTFEEMPLSAHHEKTRAYIKIQDGCNNYCAYCIIPYLRGPVRSRSVASVVQEAARLAAAGYKEIVLNGINLSSYGRDLKTGENLLSVLRAVHALPGIERIRLGSLEPVVITQEFVSALSKLPKACRHFHLSLQSGCSSVLARMNRRYTTEEFYAAVERLRALYPDCALSADIIVGFPGESEEEFEETVRFAEKVGFAWVHVFAYSVREGTAAAKMNAQISSEIKQKRSARLIAVCREIGRAYRERFVGREVTVLCQQAEEGKASGLTDEHLEVEFSCGNAQINSLIRVRVTGVTENGLCAEALE